MHNYKSRTVLVTGDSGFLGKGLTTALLEEGASVIGYSKSRGDGDEAQKILDNENFTALEGDILDLEPLEKIEKDIGKPDVIFHLAGQPYVWFAKKNPIVDFRTNALGTFGMLNYAKDNGSRLVFSSTMAVYGRHQEPPFFEVKAEPGNCYGLSKFTAESYIRYFNRDHGVESVILRFSHLYGPYMRSRVVYEAIKGIVEKHEKINLYMNPKSRLDLLYRGDAVDALLTTGTVTEAKGDTINISTGEAHDINEVIDIIHKEVDGPKAEILEECLECPVFSAFADNSRAKELLDWKPKTGLEEGILNTVKWYKEEGRE